MSFPFPVPDEEPQLAVGNSKRQRALLLTSILLRVDKKNIWVGAEEAVSKPSH
jgi:hypothetical protein